MAAVQSFPAIADRPEFKAALRQDDDSDPVPEIRKLVDLGLVAEQQPLHSSEVNVTDVQKIKASPLYRDQGYDSRRNWLGAALERLKNLQLKKKKRTNPEVPDLSIFGRLLTYIMWTLLVGGVLFFLAFAFRHVKWRRNLVRRSKTLLQDDEPVRSLDEWVELANQLTARGHYREAVRALYLACLIRFDEAGVARFDRGETNWEHLHRIQASPKYPRTIDFLEPTKRFDQVWYGFQSRGKPDVDQFQIWYAQISDGLRSAA